MLPLMFSSTSLIIVNNSSSVGACPMASSTCLNSHTSIVPLRSLSNARKASLPVEAKRRSRLLSLLEQSAIKWSILCEATYNYQYLLDLCPLGESCLSTVLFLSFSFFGLFLFYSTLWMHLSFSRFKILFFKWVLPKDSGGLSRFKIRYRTDFLITNPRIMRTSVFVSHHGNYKSFSSLLWEIIVPLLLWKKMVVYL